MHWIKGVKYLKDYLLQITFNNNEVRIVDMKPFVGGEGIFKPLEDLKYFRTVHVDHVGNSICWENGADVCPDVLYENSTGVSEAIE